MSDCSIRAIDLAEQAEQAARRFMATGEPEQNPHAGTPQEQRWRSCYDRWILQLSAADQTEGGA